MATTSETTYTHTCDLCGTARPRGELRRLGATSIVEGAPSVIRPTIDGRTCDVCTDCHDRPVSEVLARLASEVEQETGRMRHLMAHRTA